MITDRDLDRYELLELVDELRHENTDLKARLRDARQQRDDWRERCTAAVWGQQDAIRQLRALRRRRNGSSPESTEISTGAALEPRR